MAIKGKQNSVTTAAAVIFAGGGGLDDPQSAIVTNQDATNSVFLGGADVTTSNGYELKAGASVAVAVSANDAPGLYAVAGATVRVDTLANRQ